MIEVIMESADMEAIAYTRVSTGKQGSSGLGLAAQQAAIRAFAEREGVEVTQWFQEVETGKGSDALDRRPQLAAALNADRMLRIPVLVSKLDRLSIASVCSPGREGTSANFRAHQSGFGRRQGSRRKARQPPA
jgi:hypothetical protein